MNEEHLYIVCYDIRDPRRWRKVFRKMQGYGEWLQLSVFQCRLNRIRLVELMSALDQMIHHDEDHVIVLDLGLADRVQPKIVSLGKTVEPVQKGPIIV